MKLNLIKYFRFVVVALLFIVSFSFYFQRYYYHYDDAFITYTFARNLAEGNGIVFHPSFSPIQGSSTLLYTLLLAILNLLLRIDVHTIGFILSVLFFTLVIALYTAILQNIFPNVTQRQRLVFFAILFLFQLPLYLSLGLEIIFLNFILLLILYMLLSKDNLVAASILLSIVPLTRLDYAFFIPAFVIVFYIRKKSIKNTLVFLIPVTLCIGFYLISAFLYFGEFVPYSWIAKGYFPANVSGVIRLQDYVLNPSYMLFFGTGLLSVIYFGFHYVRTKHYEMFHLSFSIFLVFCLLYLSIFEYKGAPNMPWYMVTLLYFVQYLIWYIAYYFLNQKKFLLFGIIMAVAVAVAVAGSFLGMNDYSKKMTIKTSSNTYTSKLWHNDRREKCALFLRDSIQDIKNKKILLFEAGKIPYYSQAKCYDVLGLVSREALEGLEEKNTTLTLGKTQPDIIVGVNQSYYFPMAFLKSSEFKSNYSVMKEFDGYVIWELRRK